ncbi:MAG: SagB/ThcOx family dehydrogenase [Actinomycetota bacterium]|nr:SagB/ThcOx family dehydrogenase [Actinomycetota bacterium]
MNTASSRPIVDLPAPSHGGMSLDQTLATRRTVRELTGPPLTDAELSQLLWSAQGLTPAGNRTAPSAGATYPTELYLLTADGVFHYRPHRHDLEIVSGEDERLPLFDNAVGQEAVRDAPAVFVVSAVFERTEAKYGERAARYVHIEAGHVAQNLLLQATALGLGAVPVGDFDDAAVSEILGLPSDHEPLYLLPVGHPAAGR